jgi:hypothetical protein
VAISRTTNTIEPVRVNVIAFMNVFEPASRALNTIGAPPEGIVAPVLVALENTIDPVYQGIRLFELSLACTETVKGCDIYDVAGAVIEK